MEICGTRCGCSPSRAHARGAESAGVAGYLGAGDQFDEAMGDFALAHAGQPEHGHAAPTAAMRTGSVTVATDA